MNQNCAAIQERLSALIDGELESEETVAVEAHLETCGACRRDLIELLQIRGATQNTFEAVLSGAPPFPEGERESGMNGRTPRSFRRRGGFLALAASILVIVCLMIVTQDAGEVQAAILLRQAGDNFGKAESVEFEVRFKSPAAEFLVNVLSDEPKPINYPVVRATAMAPNRLLVRHRDAEQKGDAYGFDGTTVWVYEADKQEVVVTTLQKIIEEEMKKKGDLPGDSQTFLHELRDMDITRYLSWEYVHALTRKNEWVEVTTSLHKKAARRAFLVVLKPEKKGEKKKDWLSTHLTLTIDTNNDSIEGLEMEIQVFSLPVLQVYAEITQMNPQVSPALFDYRTHVAPGTKVVLKESGENK